MVIHIEDYEHGHIYTNTNGCSKSGWCATTDDKEKWGAVIAIVDGATECEKYLFVKSWELEAALNKEFLLAIIPELQQRISDGSVQGLFLNDLYKQAFKKMRDLGYTKTCPRCGGSGNYSYNQRDGTRCFMCGGKKKILQKVTKKLVAEIKKQS